MSQENNMTFLRITELEINILFYPEPQKSMSRRVIMVKSEKKKVLSYCYYCCQNWINEA